MPRAKKATKAAVFVASSEEAVVSSTTNSGSIFSEEEEQIAEKVQVTEKLQVVEKVEEKPAPSKSRGRAKKIVTPPPVEEAAVPEKVETVEVKKPAARGRGAKKPKAVEEPLEQELESVDVKKPEEAPKPAKGPGRGRKKQESTAAPEANKVEEAAPENVPEKRSKRAATKVKDYKEPVEEEEEDQPQQSNKKPAAKRGRAKKVVTPVAEQEQQLLEADEEDKAVLEDVKKPAAKRGRAKKSATPEIQAEMLDEEPLESPNKKAKPVVAAEKKKRGNAKANVAAADIDEEQEEKEHNEETQKPVEVAEKKNNKKTNDKPAKVAVAAVAEKKPARGRKRVAPVVAEEQPEEDVDEDEADGSKPSKKAKKVAAPPNSGGTAYNKADFDLPPIENGVEEDSTAKRFNLKISSWNVAGLRAWVKKDGLKFLEYEEPDIFCMQETKCTTDQLPEEAERISGYHPYWLCFPGGHDGVAIYSKIMPIHVEYGIGDAEFDEAGRLITAEYEKFFLINVYVPNSGRKLVRLEPRMRWEKLFQAYVQQLEARKPVVICGDMNVSHREIDLANPKTNTRNAGFTKEERDKMSELLALGYIDTFRLLYPERKSAYTFWTYLGNARARNIGWRLDYFLVSERLSKRVVENCMRTQCMGSDHCPITLFLNM